MRITKSGLVIRTLNISAIKIEYIFLFFCFFPFIGPLSDFDNQPIALIFAFLILVSNSKIRVKYFDLLMLSLGLVILLASISLAVNGFYAVLKRLYSYVCIFLIPIAFYNSNINVVSDEFEKHIKAYMWVWFIVALIQRFYKKNFGLFLLSNMRTDDMRGVTSLSNEPSFYGYAMFFFLMFCLDFKEKKRFYIILSIAQMLLLAQSTVSIIYICVLVGGMVVRTFSKRSVKDMLRVIAIGMAFVVTIVFLMNRFATSRIGSLLFQIIHDPTTIIYTDQSVYERWTSLMTGFSNLPYPNWMGGVTIMSGYGGIVYDFGIFAIVFIIYIYKLIQSGCNRKLKWVIPMTLTVCMFSGIQLSSPLFAAYIGYCAKKAEVM